MTKTRQTTIKRLTMRSMRRGIKEMDLILPAFAGVHLDQMDDAALDLYEALLAENDHDLYQWVTGQDTAPEHYAGLIALIAQGAQGIVAQA